MVQDIRPLLRPSFAGLPDYRRQSQQSVPQADSRASRQEVDRDLKGKPHSCQENLLTSCRAAH